MIRIREPHKEELISEFDQKGGMKGGEGEMNMMNGVNSSRLAELSGAHPSQISTNLVSPFNLT